MLDRARILALIPHQGAMCLLDSVVRWDEREIVCRAVSHCASDNPLRHEGRLGALAGVEYCLQAACLHGALTAGGQRQEPGYLAALRDVQIGAGRLDDPQLGALSVTAALELRQEAGMIYRFALAAADGRILVEGRASIVLPRLR
jgi:predicted hotdog family 3-hydroxylacyl-ACP dehydratase